MEKVDDLLRAGKEINEFIDNAAGGRGHQNEDRGKLLMAFLHVAQEHHRSILLLIEKRLYGSAFALQRPLYETVLRGFWVGGSATDSEVNAILTEKDFPFPSAKKMAELVDGHFGMETFFQDLHRSAFNAMCGYTHTGTHQISRRFKDASITWNYEEGEILEVIHGSNVLILFNANVCFSHFNYIEEKTTYQTLFIQYFERAKKTFSDLREI